MKMSNPRKPHRLCAEVHGGTLVLRLNRPAVSNAIDLALLADIDAAIRRAEDDNEVKVVIITGEGQNFSVGADLKEVESIQSPEDFNLFFSRFHRVYDRIESMEKPTIAAINGLALGGGCELCLACDIRIAASNASLGLPEITLGTLPGAGGTQRLPRLIGPSRALEMLYTGGTLDAEEGYIMGLINRVVGPDKIMDEALALASNIGAKSSMALRMAKVLVRDGLKMDIEAALTFEKQSVIKLSTSPDSRDRMKAFAAKRKAKAGEGSEDK